MTNENNDLIDPRYVWNNLTNEQRIASAMIVFEAIRDHIKDGGTFRYLIYNRLGLGTDSYISLYSSGGMIISNFINTFFKKYMGDKENG